MLLSLCSGVVDRAKADEWRKKNGKIQKFHLKSLLKLSSKLDVKSEIFYDAIKINKL